MKTWNSGALAQANKVLACQDKFIASLGLTIHKGIDTGNYGLIKLMLNHLSRDARALELAAGDLVRLYPKGKGRPPKWFDYAEDILYFAIQAQKQIQAIRADMVGNYWKIIGTRLDKCYRQCRKQQRELIGLIPAQFAGESDAVEQAAQLIETLEMGTTYETGIGKRWRRS